MPKHESPHATGRDDAGSTPRTLVWDAPVRVAHWLVALCVLAAWLTRDARYIDFHAAAGYCALALCAFRIAWGFFGTRHARFRDFAYSPRAALAYLKALAARRAPGYAGHNPAGSWSVLALLALQLVAGTSGVVAIAGMHGLGPLAGRVPHALADLSLRWHELVAWIMLAVIVAHLVGVAASSIAHGENLVAAMFTGMKRAPQAAAIGRHRGLAAALALLAGAIAFGYLAASRAFEPKRAPDPAHVAVSLDARWRAECESCHLPYAPCMLPQRSWRAMLDGQADHFGEDLALDAGAIDALLAAAARPIASEPWACWKTRTSIPDGAVPLRIAQSPYWREAHASLDARAFRAPVSSGAHDCGACHRDAASSIFHPRMIHIPQ